MFSRNTMNWLGPLAAVTLGLALVAPAHATTYTWTPTAAGTYNWDDASSNWTSGFPNAVDDTATLAIDLAGAQTIDLNQAISIGTLNIGDTGSDYYATTIQNGTAGSLTFDVATGSAVISKATAGNTATDIISATITLNDNINITNDATAGGLTISGNIGEGSAGKALTKLGAGTVSLSVTTPTFGGLTGSANLASVITSGYGSVTALTLNPGTATSYTYYLLKPPPLAVRPV